MTAYAALAQPSRRQILDVLRDGERSVNELVVRVGLSQPGVSKHLTLLREARLPEGRPGGKRRWYGLRAAGDGCVLLFTPILHPDLGPSWQPAAGWETYFSRLDAHLAGGRLSELEAHEGVDDLIAEYREAFQPGATRES